MLKLITVRENHIKFRKQNSCWSCPVALAVNAILSEGSKCTVSEVQIALYNKSGTFVAQEKLEIAIGDKIQLFDDTKIMVPFQFFLEIPEEIAA